ncbi:MAG: PhzF family phenazine biosynthesis protein [Deltaproteobacteria bacterium]|jgi:PhzF family phenazine biosynthesis protein|nr:PhzF family phenazine biosynthesis protein [Deltaproteobacteria bacterium]
MIQKVFLVDALVDGPFSGSPTSVFFLESPLERFKMASLAGELGSPESVYVLPHGEAFLLRFFTPLMELKAGVHAAQAAAHLIYELGVRPPTVPLLFLTLEGELKSRFHPPNYCSLELVSEKFRELDPAERELYAPMLGLDPKDALWGVLTSGNIAVLRVPDYASLKKLVPVQSELLKAAVQGVAATSPGKQGGDCDYYLRSFRPKVGVPEEHVGGGIHRSLAHYWGKLLNKTSLVSRQLSKRGGLVSLEVGDPAKVVFKGKARTILRSDVIQESLVLPPAFSA